MFPVKYELGFYIPEDDILRSHRRENLKSYICSYYVSNMTLVSHSFVSGSEEDGTHPLEDISCFLSELIFCMNFWAVISIQE
jgi:hypothetical protein